MEGWRGGQKRANLSLLKCNKWSKNLDKRPHHRPVTPRGCEWIRPAFIPIPWAHTSQPQSGISISSAVFAELTNVTNRHTHTPSKSIAIAASYAMHALWPNNNNNIS